MNFPTTIHESNVLDGIADAVAIIRSPLTNDPEQDVTITFDTGQHNPPLLHFDAETKRFRKFRNDEIDYDFVVRARIVFSLPFLTATEAAKWRRVWNEYMNGYHIIMRPHNDSGLKLEFNVIPTPQTTHVLRYVTGKYIGHETELSFTARGVTRAMNLQSSAVTFHPILT